MGYVRKCLNEVRLHLVKAQRDHDNLSPDFYWDLRNGLTLYLVVLGEIAAGRILRYFEPLQPTACMAAYLGHDRMLRILERNGVSVSALEWSSLNILFSAILGRRFRLVKRILSRYPQLRATKHLWYGHAGSFCAGFGSVRILRFLRNAGFDMREVYRHPKMPPDKPGHWGSALLFAVENRRRSLIADLVAHEEFCPWEGLVFSDGRLKRSFFVDAVRNRCYGVARIYLENGWLDRPKTEDEFWDLLRRTEAEFDFKAFHFLEDSFPSFDAKRIVREHIEEDYFDARIRRYCGAPKKEPDPLYRSSRETVEDICDSIRHWIKMERPDMIRYQLDIVPEVLPLVWPELREPIQAAFAEMPADGEPCRRYLFRLARSLGIELFKNDESKRFWEDKCDTVIPWENTQTIDDVFPLAEELDGGYLPPKEIRPKIYQALHALGKAARRFLDDPDINPNIDLSWNWPFFVWLGYYADWKTYKGWLLRGMEIYRDNMDDPGDFELGSTPSIVRHLLPDLEHRPWISKHYTGNTLGYAAADGDTTAVKQILKEGCPVNFHRGVAGDKISPLRAALLHDRDAVARLLYAAGGMNIQNGVVYPVPSWIAKPRPLHVAKIRKTLGDACRDLKKIGAICHEWTDLP